LGLTPTQGGNAAGKHGDVRRKDGKARMTTKLTTARAHGPGSAGLFLFGRMLRRQEPEDDKGGGGSSEGETGGDGDTTSGDKQADKPTGSGERTYTGKDVERIVQERLERERRRNTAPAKSDKRDDAKKPSKAESRPESDTWFVDFSDAVDAVSEEMEVKVPLKLKQRMRAAFRADTPDDPTTWVKSWLDDVGLKKPEPAAAKAATTEPNDKAAEKKAIDTQAQPNGKTLSDKGTAAVTKDVDDIIDPRELTAIDVERIHEKHGVDKGNELISRKVMGWLKGVKVVPDRGGPRR
jgi:hypothetical protein